MEEKSQDTASLGLRKDRGEGQRDVWGSVTTEKEGAEGGCLEEEPERLRPGAGRARGRATCAGEEGISGAGNSFPGSATLSVTQLPL